MQDYNFQPKSLFTEENNSPGKRQQQRNNSERMSTEKKSGQGDMTEYVS